MLKETGRYWEGLGGTSRDYNIVGGTGTYWEELGHTGRNWETLRETRMLR